MIVDAIILARGGSKGIPNKNIIDFCGKPLIVWTIEQCSASKLIRNIWVSSDHKEILQIASQCGAKTILRPSEITGDNASSESGWLHAVEHIENNDSPIELVLAPQVTSPLRETSDFNRGIEKFIGGNYDSMFSCSLVKDLFFWEKTADDVLRSVNYDYLNRKRRQDVSKQMIENGSFYLFTPESLRNNDNRFDGNIGCTEMKFWKMFEIDSMDDLKMCSALMKEFLLKEFE